MLQLAKGIISNGTRLSSRSSLLVSYTRYISALHKVVLVAYEAFVGV